MQENRMMNYLINRGLSEAVLKSFGICSYDHPHIGHSIKIPITDDWAKYRRDPASDIKPKYVYDKGGKATLFGIDHIKDEHKTVLITEGELDTLMAWSNNIPAVSSTGGANTFKEEWVELLEGKDVIIAFDNDDAGAAGAVKVLDLFPHAKVLLIPERPNMKDLTDYVQQGGNLAELLKTARGYGSMAEVKEDRANRISVFGSVRFHNAYIDKHTPKFVPKSKSTMTFDDDDRLMRAKSVPIPNFLEFKGKQRLCIWHNEKSPSMAYYPETNSVYCFGCAKHGDAIDVYRRVNNCDFLVALDDLNKMI